MINEYLTKLEVPHENNDIPNILKNPDLEPMPPSRRIWGFWSFFGYWAVPNITVWTWSTGSAMLGLGLNIQHTMGALTLGNLLIILYTCLNSTMGLKYHIGYTVCMRLIFGIYGSGIGILIRFILSVVFYGSQSWLGGLGLVVTFSSFSKDFMNMKNTFPDSVAMTTRDFIGFFVFLVIQIFFLFMKPERMNKYVNLSCAACAAAFIAIFGVCLKKNHGPGSLFHEGVNMSSSKTAWMWLYSMTIWYGALSPDVTNQSDFSRFASSKRKMYLGIITSVLITGTFVPLFGLLCASATQDLYGTAMWLPTDIVLQWMGENYNSGLRAGAFFLGIAFAFSQLTFNVLAMGFAGGMDLAGVYPRFINIRRGAIITALLSWVVQPWRFYNTSSVFMNVMSSFGVIVTPIIAILIADFMVVRNYTLPLLDLYSTHPDGTFYFLGGFNLRAILVWLAAAVPGIPGLIGRVQDVKIPAGLNNFYFGNIIFGFVCPFVLYIIVCKVFPPKNLGVCDDHDYFENYDVSNQGRIEVIVGSEVSKRESFSPKEKQFDD